jgi:hypothetical protein
MTHLRSGSGTAVKATATKPAETPHTAAVPGGDL